MAEEIATLAGGCFWCVEAVFDDVIGVASVESGYIGGHAPHPTYKQVCGGDTGHAEAIRVAFDPDVIGYGELLDIFFHVHDPTQLNRQGNDIGRSYRSAIFYTSPEQERVARDTIADVDASGLWPGKVVTEVEPAGEFWEAEEEHQDYLQKYPAGYTCHWVRPNWRLPHREAQTA